MIVLFYHEYLLFLLIKWSLNTIDWMTGLNTSACRLYAAIMMVYLIIEALQHYADHIVFYGLWYGCSIAFEDIRIDKKHKIWNCCCMPSPRKACTDLNMPPWPWHRTLISKWRTSLHPVDPLFNTICVAFLIFLTCQDCESDYKKGSYFLVPLSVNKPFTS